MSIEKVYLLYGFGFEWDHKKSAQNKKKHGVSFLEAIEIWQSEHLTVTDIAYSNDGEKRSATIGTINGGIYTAIWTQRMQSVRLISVRKARKYEKEAYRKKIL